MMHDKALQSLTLANGKFVDARRAEDANEANTLFAHSQISFIGQPPFSEWFSRDGRWVGIFSGRSQNRYAGNWNIKDGDLTVIADLPPGINVEGGVSQRSIYLDAAGRLYVARFFEAFSKGMPEYANHHPLIIYQDAFRRDVPESELLDRMFASSPSHSRIIPPAPKWLK